MKKTFVIISLFLFLFEFSSQSQGLYSLQNLQQSSTESLKTLLSVSMQQKKTGAFIIKTGLITAVAGFLIASTSHDKDDWIGINTGTVVGAWMVLFGTGVTIVGLPILISGSNRVKRISGIISQSSSSVILEIAPYRFQSSITQKNQYGATLRIRF